MLSRTATCNQKFKATMGVRIESGLERRGKRLDRGRDVELGGNPRGRFDLLRSAMAPRCVSAIWPRSSMCPVSGEPLFIGLLATLSLSSSTGCIYRDLISSPSLAGSISPALNIGYSCSPLVTLSPLVPEYLQIPPSHSLAIIEIDLCTLTFS